MARFITVHRSPGLSQDEVQGNVPAVLECRYASFEQMFVDMAAGFIVTVYEADDQAALEREFERLGFPWDEVHPLHFAADRAKLQQMLQGAHSQG